MQCRHLRWWLPLGLAIFVVLLVELLGKTSLRLPLDGTNVSMETNSIKLKDSYDDLIGHFFSPSTAPATAEYTAAYTATASAVNTAAYTATSPATVTETSKEVFVKTGNHPCNSNNVKLPDWLRLLPSKEFKVYSQSGEDGITLELVKNVPLAAQGNNFYVEFGTESGMERNTRVLSDGFVYHGQNWTGLLMDGSNVNSSINLHQEIINADNIVSLLEKYEIYPQTEIGYFSEDTDYSDYYIWHAVLSAGYKPRIVVSEINGNYLPTESGTVHRPAYNQTRFWEWDDYFGLSALALKRLWNRFGYVMVYCTRNQVNCFGVRADLLLPASIDIDMISISPDPSSSTNRQEQSSTMIQQVQECLWIFGGSSDDDDDDDDGDGNRQPMAFRHQMHNCSANAYLSVIVHEDGEVVNDKHPTIEEFIPQFRQDCIEAKNATIHVEMTSKHNSSTAIPNNSYEYRLYKQHV